MTNEFKLTIYRLIEEAEKMDMGLFAFYLNVLKKVIMSLMLKIGKCL